MELKDKEKTTVIYNPCKLKVHFEEDNVVFFEIVNTITKEKCLYWVSDTRLETHQTKEVDG